MLYIAGELCNFLEQARSVVDITGSPFDPLFPMSRLWDGYADAAGAQAANHNQPTFQGDLAIKDKDGNDNGNLDSWITSSQPAYWTTFAGGTGSVNQDTPGRGGAGSAAKLIKGSGGASITKVYKVRAGQRMRFSLWMKVAGDGLPQAQLVNLRTGKYLHDDMTWSTTPQYFAFEDTSTSYVEKTGSFVVEDFRANGDEPIAYLELSVWATGAGTNPATDWSYVDDVFIWPHWNAFVISGHNIEARLRRQLHSSTDNFAANNVLVVAARDIRQPAFYGYTSTPVTARYFRLQTEPNEPQKFNGRQWYGEVAITYLESASAGGSSEWTYSVRYMPDNIVQNPPGGKVIATRTAQQRRRAIALHFTPPGDAVMREQRDEIHGRCHGSLFPAILVPVDAEDVVVHARVDESLEIRRLFLASWENDLLFSENPFPRVTP